MGVLWLSLDGKRTGYYMDICWLTNGSVAWPVFGYIAAYLNARAIKAPVGWYVRERLPRQYRYEGPCGEIRVKRYVGEKEETVCIASIVKLEL